MTCTFSSKGVCAYVRFAVTCDGADKDQDRCPLWNTRVTGTVFNSV